jgi:predicted O-methyltransferase YrrM
VTVEALVTAAWERGRSVPLEGIRRGPRSTTGAPDYYRFLHGLCSELAVRSVLEIGTDFGGSILAMRQAIPPGEGTLVTVDITDRSDGQIGGHGGIEKIRGDSRHPDTVTRILERLSPPVDLLYVDTEHDFDNTMSAYAVYTALLTPRVLVFDDVTLNDDMRRFWEILGRRYGANAINAAALIPEVRSHPLDPGFGVVVADASLLR